MRWISVPEELTPRYLVETAEMPLPLRGMFPSIEDPLWDQTSIHKALTATDALFAVAWEERERYAAALVRLYQADLLNRQERWEEALDAVNDASGWLKLQVSQPARYNEAIAAYFEGLIHYILHADQQAVQTFIHAQGLLQESERFWKLQGEDAHLEHCRDVTRWIAQLLSLQAQSAPGDEVMIVPVYEFENKALRIRINALVVPLITFSVSGELVQAQCNGITFLPLDLSSVAFLMPGTKRYHFALRVEVNGEFVQESKTGDYLLVEASKTTTPTTDSLLNAEHVFLRSSDGTITFRSTRRGYPGFVGMPRALLREEGKANE